jgi:predicted amidohydrolase
MDMVEAGPARLRVALGQFTAAAADVAVNLSQLVTMLVDGASAGADLVCFPELCLPGYLLDPAAYTEMLIRELARADVTIAAAARDLGVRVMYGTAMAWDAKLHNAVVVVDPGGARTIYAKSHVPVLERAIFAPGEDIVVTADGDLALACCYDLAFPEFCASLADTGARALFFPMAWEKTRAFVFEGLVSARAIENIAYVVCANQTGSMGQTHYYGRSRIIDPLGEVVVEMAEEVGVVTADLDLGWVTRLRSSADSATYPLLADRRPPLVTRRGPTSDQTVADWAAARR